MANFVTLASVHVWHCIGVKNRARTGTHPRSTVYFLEVDDIDARPVVSSLPGAQSLRPQCIKRAARLHQRSGKSMVGRPRRKRQTVRQRHLTGHADGGQDPSPVGVETIGAGWGDGGAIASGGPWRERRRTSSASSLTHLDGFALDINRLQNGVGGGVGKCVEPRGATVAGAVRRCVGDCRCNRGDSGPPAHRRRTGRSLRS